MTRQIIFTSLPPCLVCSCVPGRQGGSVSVRLGYQIMMLKILVTTFLLLPFILTTVHATTQSAEEVVRSTLDQVIEQLRFEKEDHVVNPERSFDLIQDRVVPHFDFPIMSRWILDKNWNKASQKQRHAFIDEFKSLMISTYAKTLMKYSVKEIRYSPVQTNPVSNLAIVKIEIWTDSSTHIIDGANPILINYKMHISNGEWKVIDITVDGISLVRTYRGLFASEIRKYGLDSLITNLMKRNSKFVNSLSQRGDI